LELVRELSHAFSTGDHACSAVVCSRVRAGRAFDVSCGIFSFFIGAPIAFDARERHGNSTERSTARAHQRKKPAYVCPRARIRAPRRCHCRSTQAQHASNIVAAQLRPLLPRRQRDTDGTDGVSIEAFADFSLKRVRCHATYTMLGALPMHLHGRFCC
jgi:hypothetical protein